MLSKMMASRDTDIQNLSKKEKKDLYRTTTEDKCIMCNRYLRKSNNRRKRFKSETEIHDFCELIGMQKNISVGDIVCNKCRINAFQNKRDRQNNNQKNSNSESNNCSEDTNNNINNNINNNNNNSNIVFKEDSVSKEKLMSDSNETSDSESCSENDLKSDEEKRDPIFFRKVSVDETEKVELPFNRVISTHNYCFVCGFGKKQPETTLRRVPLEARIQVFTLKRLFIPKGNRCCSSHLINDQFYEDEIVKMKMWSNFSEIEVTDLTNFLKHMSINTDKTILDKIGEYSLSEDRLKTFTGLNWENIIELEGYLTSLRNTESRSVTQALVTFLFKMRSGNSNQLISSILQLEDKQQVSRWKNSVLKAFEKDILSSSFGLKNVTRADIIENTSEIARKLLNLSDDTAVVICDGTYIYHQKSSNNDYQKISFSGQKKRHLCKPFTIATTNGFVIDMAGPFTANLNDAEILKKIITESDDFIRLLKKGDIIILDRGFRDIKEYLEALGFIVLMPAIKGKRQQIPWNESNESRFVTKLRWPVEAIHGDVKQHYKILDNKLHNNHLKNVKSYCQIACYLHNKYSKRLESDKKMMDEIVTYMKSKRNEPNSLVEEVQSERWNRRKVPFKSVSSTDILDFPKLSEDELIVLFTGSYQLKQTVSYLGTIVTDENEIELKYVKEKKNIIQILVPSRHVNRKTYKCYIDYEPKGKGVRSIKRYCCDCPNGCRTVGCCSHVASIIYFLSRARYMSKIFRPAEVLSSLFVTDRTVVSIQEDSDYD